MTTTSDRYRYALATHTVMKLIGKGQSPLDAAYNAATDKNHRLGLNQFGRLVREAEERYGEQDQ